MAGKARVGVPAPVVVRFAPSVRVLLFTFVQVIAPVFASEQSPDRATAVATFDPFPTQMFVLARVGKAVAAAAHVPSPRQKVLAVAPVPLFKLVTGRFPVTSAERLTALHDGDVPPCKSCVEDPAASRVPVPLTPPYRISPAVVRGERASKPADLLVAPVPPFVIAMVGRSAVTIDRKVGCAATPVVGPANTVLAVWVASVPVSVPAAAVTVILDDPSNEVPLIVLAFCKIGRAHV